MMHFAAYANADAAKFVIKMSRKCQEGGGIAAVFN
jgi:hypothetical protein